MIEIAWAIGRAAVVFGIVMALIPFLTWMERKGAAYIQDRRGPNRADILGIRLGGLMHAVADGIKLLVKEEVSAAGVLRPLAIAAPAIAFIAATATVAVVPFSGPVSLGGRTIALQVADLGAGLVYVFAVSSLGAYALLIAGWSSQSGYAVTGALRAAAQFVSYGVALSLAALSIFLVAGSLSLTDIAADQGVIPWHWNICRQPLAFAIFFAALVAEAARLPFDLPEGDSEIVAGYHVEYSSMRFAMFYMAEYAHIVVGSAVVASLFLGGWQIPFAGVGAIAANARAIAAAAWPIAAVLLMLAGGALCQRFRRRFHDRRDYEPVVIGSGIALAGLALAILYKPFAPGLIEAAWVPAVITFAIGIVAMLAKTLLVASAFIWVRWSLPRFRYDQLMGFGWKWLVPLGMLNLIVTAAVMMYLQGRS